MTERANETCWLFVDDSNIWIEAQKAAAAGNTHLPKLADRDRDPRLRIDIGKLASRLCKGRIRGFSALYGSRPPPNDGVWAAFGKHNFEVHIFDKSLKNKEKEVDTEMAADLVEKATELRVGAKSSHKIGEEKKNSVFVVITGDRDMIPPIRRVLTADIRVELWGWRSGISKDYYRLCAEYPELMSVNHLETEAANIFFTNTRSTRLGRPDPAKTLVLQVDNGIIIDEDSVSMELSRLQHVFYTNSTLSKTALFVEFPNVSNVETMLIKVKEIFDSRCTVLSWPEYTNSSTKTPTETPLESRNMYEVLMNDGASDPDSTAMPKDSQGKTGLANSRSETMPSSTEGPGRAQPQGITNPDIEGWETVSRANPANDHRRHQRQRQRCPERIRCSKKGDCAYWHSPEEKRTFDNNPNRDMTRWKTRKCHHENCHFGANCGFAHSKEESWCLHCRIWGHCLDDCQWASKANR